jgi:hypothetical protein
MRTLYIKNDRVQEIEDFVRQEASDACIEVVEILRGDSDQVNDNEDRDYLRYAMVSVDWAEGESDDFVKANIMFHFMGTVNTNVTFDFGYNTRQISVDIIHQVADFVKNMSDFLVGISEAE